MRHRTQKFKRGGGSVPAISERNETAPRWSPVGQGMRPGPASTAVGCEGSTVASAAKGQDLGHGRRQVPLRAGGELATGGSAEDGSSAAGSSAAGGLVSTDGAA